MTNFIPLISLGTFGEADPFCVSVSLSHVFRPHNASHVDVNTEIENLKSSVVKVCVRLIATFAVPINIFLDR
jgi:hypothetical protein